MIRMSLLPLRTNVNASTPLYAPASGGGGGGGGGGPDLVVSSITTNQLSPGDPDAGIGGIYMNPYDSRNNAISTGQVAILAGSNFDAYGSTVQALNICQFVNGPAPFLEAYNGGANIAARTIYLGGDFEPGLPNGMCAGSTVTRIETSGPKPFITAVSSIWPTSVPPYLSPTPPSLLMSPLITETVTASTVQSLSSNLVISNQQGASIVLGDQALAFENPYNVVLNASTPLGAVRINTDNFELFSPSNSNVGMGQINLAFTKIWNNSGVQLGVTGNTNELQITSGQVSIPSSLLVSSINNEQPAYRSMLSSLFAANPSLSTIVY